MTESLLSLRGLAGGYGRLPVVSGVDLDLRAGETTVLLGANGSGKSTLLRTVLGLQPPVAGEVRLMGRPLREVSPTDRARFAGAVLSDRPRPWGLTVLEVVEQGRFARRRDDRACGEALEAVHARHLAGRRVSELSDGELQRVHVARALAQEPRVLVLDEPTSCLDQPRRREMILILKKLARDRSMAVLLSLHDLDLALTYADRCLLLAHGGASQGIAEDLILQGEVARAYGQPTDWNPLALPEPERPVPWGVVDLFCPPPYRSWVARGLDRAGISQGRGAVPLSVRSDCDGLTFRLELHDGVLEHRRLEQVIRSFRERGSAP